MSVHLITGYAGAGHVTSADAGRFNAGVCGTSKYVMCTGTQFAYTIKSNNEIEIESGDLVNQGRHVSIPQNSTEIAILQNGAQNRVRTDAIVIRYEKNAGSGVETASLVVIKGTDVTSGSEPPKPALRTGNIFNGDAIDDFLLYYVTIDNFIVTKVEKAFTVVPALSNIMDFVYPVGSIYMAAVNVNPGKIFGGTWERINGKFLFAADNGHAAGTTGGEENVTLTEQQIPSHTHVGGKHTHTTPNHTHTFITGNESANHNHGTGKTNHRFTTNLYLDSDPTGRRKVASGSSYYAMTTTTSDAGNIAEVANTGSQSAHHTHSGTTAAAAPTTNEEGAVNTGAAGGGTSHNNMPPYLSVYVWKRTA
ncbi:MAG: hypothetical protein MJ117_00215 [Lachnospiraceae bacterium]|nr:hypothetical protein [Lachnospiraceae bacterium]